MVTGEKFQSHAKTLTSIGQRPTSNSSELFSYTYLSLSFNLINSLFFELSCQHTHTHTGEYSIVAVDNRNYNNWPQIGISTFKELTRPLWILLGNYGSTIMGCASHFI